MSSQAPEANFKFWAITIPKNSEKSLQLKDDNFVYHVSNATLGQGVNRGRTTVFCKANGEEAAICNLVHSTIENASLDLIISRSMNASFIVKGPNAVTVSGYIQPLVEESDSEMASVEKKSKNEALTSAVKVSETAEKEEKPDPVESKKEAAPIEKKKETATVVKEDSKKRKIEEVEKAKTDPPGKKRSKKKNQKADETQEIDKKNAKSEEVVETKKQVSKPKVAETKKQVSKPKVVKEKSRSTKGSKSKKVMVKIGRGIRYRILKKAKVELDPTKKGDQITLLYIGCLKDGTQFDKDLKEGLTFKVGKGKVISGMELGVIGMFPGEKRRIIIPPEQGYGKEGAGDGKIPPNAELHFTVQRK